MSHAEIETDLQVLERSIDEHGHVTREARAGNALFEAIDDASPALAESLVIPTSSERSRAKLLASVRRYAMRGQQRATPFGVFAGVGIPTVHPGRGAHSEWMNSLVMTTRSAARCAPLLENSAGAGHLYANLLASFEGDEVVVEEVVLSGPAASPRQASTRGGAAVRAAWTAARGGIARADLIHALSDLAPTVADERINHLVDVLIDAQVLLRLPEATTPAKIVQAEARPLSSHSGSSEMEEGARWMRVSAVEPPDIGVQRRVDRLARRLVQTRQHFPFAEARRRYGDRFAERYGIGVRVPLLEAVRSAGGVGHMSATKDTATREELPQAHRDVLDGLLERASHGTVALSETDINALTDPIRRDLAYRTDVLYRHDPSTDRLSFAVMATTALEGQSLGRFWQGLPPKVTHDEHLFDPLGREVEPVEFFYLPREQRDLDVMNMPRSTRRYITAHFTSGSPDEIPLDEIDLAHDGDTVWLLARDSRVPLVIRNRSMYNHELRGSALVKTVLGLGLEPERPWIPFSWGPTVALPKVPEVTYEGVVVSKGTWRIPSRLLDKTVPANEWMEKFSEWSMAAELPQWIEAGAGDNLLAFDVRDRSGALDARDAMRRDSPVLFRAPMPGGTAPVEYIQTVDVGRQPQDPTAPFPSIQLFEQSKIAREWVSAELVLGGVGKADPSRLVRLVQKARELGARDWHFVQYRESDEHLRWRAHLPDPSAREKMTEALLDLADSEQTVIRLVPFRPEYQRYGGEAAFEGIARIFTQSSDHALSAQARRARRPSERLAVAAASATAMLDAILPGQWHELFVQSYQHIRPPANSRKVLDEARTSMPRPEIGSLPRLEELALERPAESVVSSLLHMHANRFFGIDRATEHLLIALLRSLALTSTRRTQ